MDLAGHGCQAAKDDMSDVITVREFARRIGVSLTAIQKGVKTGRIEAITDAATGKITGIDFESQAQAWTANSKAPQKRPNTISGGRPRNDGQPPAKPKAEKPQPNDEPPKQQSGMSMAEVQRARELVKLQLDNLKLREAQGELVRVDVVKSDMARLAAAVKAGLMNIADRVSAQIAGMSEPHEIHALLTDEINSAISELNRTNT
jgi:hypothetical protein